MIRCVTTFPIKPIVEVYCNHKCGYYKETRNGFKIKEFCTLYKKAETVRAGQSTCAPFVEMYRDLSERIDPTR
jgi:hypothetical protein